MNAFRLPLAALLLALLSTGARAQTIADATTRPAATPSTSEAAAPAVADPAAEPADNGDATDIRVLFPNLRPPDRRGLNVFESPKSDADRLTGGEPRLRLGAAFAQQFQALDHTNTAAEVLVAGTGGAQVNANQLMDIGPGFNNATANLTLDALLTDGIHVNLTTYLSARHHNEAWVKGGYLQVDALPFFHNATVDQLMQYVTLRLGHFEVNYGDAHFRRSDNGNALYNPFVGNYIMDAFTTEIGGDLLVRRAGVFGMVGVTSGEIKGDITNPDGRSLAFLGKVGIDR
ncbi:MAG TPA: hypothetical protein VK610_06840, partial [Rhodothermales bacterium]|nr:hypothetical protein [Rhodothermales bacterium]